MSSEVAIPLREVFVPGGFPTYTYQDRSQFKVESKLLDSLKRLNKFVAVAGPTKCGKTVLVRKILPASETVWLEGGHIKTAADLWTKLASDLNVPNSRIHANTVLLENSEQHEISSQVIPGGIGAGVKAIESSKDGCSNASSDSYVSHIASAAATALTTSKKTLVIDDFHYINSAVQTDIIRGLKGAVFSGARVLFLLIPHRMHQASKAEMDVEGRTHTIEIPDWTNGELFSIAESGFRTLRVSCAATTIDQLVKESFLSPHLMQDFCSRLAADNNVYAAKGKGEKVRISFCDSAEVFFTEFSESLSAATFKSLKNGPPRTNRKDRIMQAGGTCDTYEAVLLALRRLNAASPVRWNELRRAIQDVLVDEPQQHEITRVLEMMDKIAKDKDGEPAIDYLKDEGELHLIDPFFRFYVKWHRDTETR